MYKKLLVLVVPIIATQFSQMAMGVTDTIMSGHYSTEDLAAVAIGSGLWLPLFLLLAGILMSVTPTVAHFNGAKQYLNIGHTFRQSLLLAVALGLIFTLIAQNISFVLTIMDVQIEIRPIISDYLSAISYGYTAIALFLVFRYLNEGVANTLPIMIVGLVGFLVNILINYVLIFGHWGVPAMGGVGAGWATTLTQWFMVLVLIFYTFKSPLFKKYQLFVANFKIDIKEIKQLIKLGLPIGVAFFVEGSIFSVISLFVASLGTYIVAAHQIALNITSFLFMLPLSFSMGVTILVGHAVGKKDKKALIQTIKAGYLINFIIAIAAAVLILSQAEFIVRLYTDNQQVILLATQLVFFAAFYQLSDAIQLCSGGALRGLKDTSIPMVLSVISFWGIGFPLGYLFALTDVLGPALGAKGFWIGLLIGLTLSAVLLTSRLWFQLMVSTNKT